MLTQARTSIQRKRQGKIKVWEATAAVSDPGHSATRHLVLLVRGTSAFFHNENKNRYIMQVWRRQRRRDEIAKDSEMAINW
jgi:hypothetical protein